MNYTKKAVSGVSITLLMSVLAAGIAYLTRIILARNLGPADYGLFSSVLTFILFFLFFRDLGLDFSLVKHIAKFRVQNQFNHIKTAIFSVFLFQFVSSLVFSAAFLLLSGFLAENYFKDSRASTLIILVVVYVVFSICFTLLKGIFSGFQKMFLFSSVEFTKNLIVLLSFLIFFKFGFGLYAPLLAYVVVCPLLFFIYAPFASKLSGFFSNKITDFKLVSKRVVLFGIPLFATSFAGTIIGYMDTLILTYFQPLAEVGIYNVVLPSALMILFIGRAVSSTTFPISSELWSRKDYRRLSAGVSLLHKYSFICFIPIIFTVFAFSKFFIVTFFGTEYQTGSLALQILLIGVLFFMVAMVNNTIISAIGQPKIVAKITILAAAVNLSLNLIFIPSLGINGAAITTTISYSLILFLTTVKIQQILKIRFSLKEWLKQIFAALLFISVIFVIKHFLHFSSWYELLISVCIAGTLYLISLIVLKIIDLREIKYYWRLVH